MFKYLLYIVMLVSLSHKASAVNNKCDTLVKGPWAGSSIAGDSTLTSVPQSLDAKTINTLVDFFAQLSTDEKKVIFTKLRKLDFNKVLSRLKTGESVSDLSPLLDLDMTNMNLVGNILQFGLVFPAIFQHPNSSEMVPDLLRAFKTRPNLVMGDRIFGENQSNANTLNSSIWQSITGVIRNGLADYREEIELVEGESLDFWSNIKRRARRFWETHYNRIRKIILPFAVELQKMLGREIALDEVALGKILDRKLKISEELKTTLLDRFLSDTGAAISKVEKLAKMAFGPEFKRNDPTYIHEVDLINAADRIRTVNLAEVSENQDTDLLIALDKMNSDINEDLQAHGRSTLSIEHALVKELQIYYGIFRRSIARERDDYFYQTSVKTGDSYTVTDKVRHESVTRDKNGRVKNRRVWYTYPTTDVEPSFEMVLSGHYTTGNYSNGRLWEVKESARQMVSVERPMRLQVSKAERAAYDFEEKFRRVVAETAVSGKLALREPLEKHYQIMSQQIRDLKVYMAKRPLNYRFDTEDTFENRNQAMLDRTINVHRLLEVQIEMLNRTSLMSPYITFNTWNDFHWLDLLKPYHYRNMGIKAAIALKGLAASIVVGGAYHYQTDYGFRYDIEQNYPTLMHLFQTLGNLFGW